MYLYNIHNVERKTHFHNGFHEIFHNYIALG